MIKRLKRQIEGRKEVRQIERTVNIEKMIKRNVKKKNEKEIRISEFHFMS